MALVLANRVQESATANTTVSFTLTGAVLGFQTFAVIGDTNTTFYSATDTAGNWEVGLGTYSTTGPTLTRTTIYASSNGGSAVTFPGTVNVFVTYPSGRSVNLNETGNVSALGTVSSGTWQGTTIGVAYGGTGVTASSGANSVMLRDANQNVSINRLNQANATTTAAGGTTALTAASSYSQTLVGTGNQTYTMPDATGLTTGLDFIFNNNATGTVTLRDYANGLIGTIAAGGAAEVILLDNSTVAGTWDLHGFLPEGVTFGTNAFNLGTSVISGGTWQGGTIQPGYGGTGLTTFTGANNALYSTGATTLTAGTLPVAAGGSGATTLTGYVYGNGTSAFTASASIPNSDTTATSANTANAIVARDASGNFSAGTITASLNGNASTATSATSATTATSATSATSATTATNLAGGVAGAVPYQSGAGATAFSAAGSTGQVLTSAGTSAPTWTTATDANTASAIVQRDASGNFSAGTITATLSGNATNVSGTVAVANGGTGQTTYTNGQLLIGNTTGNTLTKATLTQGTGITITNGTGSITVANAGVTSAVAGTGISVSGATGAVTITNSGVTSITGTANQITASASTGSVTLSTPQSIGTASSVQFGSLGVGTAASGTSGEIRATNNVTAYYSDDRLKTRLGKIENALDKLCSLEGFYYEANETAQALGYEVKREVGVSAQQVQAVMPEIVAPAPIDAKYLTVRYERALPLLIEAIKELRDEVRALKG